MKKLISLIIVLTMALGAYVWYQGQYINPDKVLQINIYKSGEDIPVHSYYEADVESIQKIVEIFNDLEGDSTSMPDIKSESDKYVLDIMTKDGEMLNYNLTIDLVGMKLDIYDETNEQYLYPSYEQIKTLLSMEGFYSIYDTTAPAVQLAYSTLSIPAKVSNSQWVYQLADGTKMEKKNQVVIDPVDSTIPLHPDHPIQVFSEQVPNLMKVKAYDGEVLIHEQQIENSQFMPVRYDGVLKYELTNQWNKTATSSTFGMSTVTFYGVMDLEPELAMDKPYATAGDVIVFEIFNVNKGQTVRVEQDLSKSLEVVKADDRHFAFLSMNYWAKPGNYTVKLIVEGNGSSFTKDFPVEIRSKEFNKQYLTIDKNVAASTKNEEAYAEYAKYFTPVRDESVSEKLWEGTFIQPVEGRISTEFGEMRYVNGSLTSYRHSGIDIAVPTGTVIVAPNHGIVKLSRNLIMPGETIVIDHGYGIFSVYFHLNSRSVEAGQNVEKGQVIGTVGSTGFSTGPHLHWTMSHYKTNLSPWLFMERELITFE